MGGQGLQRRGGEGQGWEGVEEGQPAGIAMSWWRQVLRRVLGEDEHEAACYWGGSEQLFTHLGVGVDGPELHALQAAVDHAV